MARTAVERREASAPAGALPRPLTLSRKRARARGNGAEDGLRVSRRSASFLLFVARVGPTGPARSGRPDDRLRETRGRSRSLRGPSRISLCSIRATCAEHDRAEGRSHRRFRRDAMVLGGIDALYSKTRARSASRERDFIFTSPQWGEVASAASGRGGTDNEGPDPPHPARSKGCSPTSPRLGEVRAVRLCPVPLLSRGAGWRRRVRTVRLKFGLNCR